MIKVIFSRASSAAGPGRPPQPRAAVPVLEIPRLWDASAVHDDVGPGLDVPSALQQRGFLAEREGPGHPLHFRSGRESDRHPYRPHPLRQVDEGASHPVATSSPRDSLSDP